MRRLTRENETTSSRMTRYKPLGAAAVVAALFSACGPLDDALTVHSRPAAEAAGLELGAETLGRLMAASPMPDSALTAHWAEQVAYLWADYVALATVYQSADTTESLDYARLLEDQRFIAAMAVQRYRDSVVLKGIEPTDEELLKYFEDEQPLTRLDVRQIVLELSPEATEADVDSVHRLAGRIREQVAGGADFLEVARANSQQPLEARGQVLSYQGHDDFPSAADSVLFTLRPGEVSPVITTSEAIYIYRVEGRHVPDFRESRNLLYASVLEERQKERSATAVDSLVENARRAVMEGAVDVARRVASDEGMDDGRTPAGLRLVTWRGGELTVEEVRRLFLVRSDIQNLFAKGSDEDLEFYLMELARDEILTTAAFDEGTEPSEEERREMATGMAYQLSNIASGMQLSHALVTDPRYDLELESTAFVERVLTSSRPAPWLGSFRLSLDPAYGIRVDERGAGAAARTAQELRADGLGGVPTPDSQPAIPEVGSEETEEG